ncbi:DUF2628 domain-containing protein [Roseomonas sp. NAR14]|uniref:DUF2628 domain-containing protein n=1 Tax=Roseomonas acroporae TaxID=2937791 RepID=A0A9X1YDZ2_9PROT|nr:DUF2628 domain-containing protein [Roseomonas acroporae]MCK8787295.1 DUF2628 domain-containing protein [Roseomonas acroporae]
MRVWTVHLPPAGPPAEPPIGPAAAAPAPGPAAGPAPPAAVVEPLLVPERFTWLAALFPPLWLLAHALWLPLLGYLALAGAIGILGALLVPAILPWAGIALHLLVGAEAQDLRRWRLGRRGWRAAGVVVARDADSALARLLDERPGGLTGPVAGGVVGVPA